MWEATQPENRIVNTYFFDFHFLNFLIRKHMSNLKLKCSVARKAYDNLSSSLNWFVCYKYKVASHLEGKTKSDKCLQIHCRAQEGRSVRTEESKKEIKSIIEELNGIKLGVKLHKEK